jgi:RsiW-degrading membrane proteinase PrsW (M82 family)
MQRLIIISVLILFGVLSVVAVWQEGVINIFSAIPRSLGSVQIFVDLVIACTLINVWIWRDAKEKGRNPWLWIIGTYLVGSFSPLVYLLVRPAALKQM